MYQTTPIQKPDFKPLEKKSTETVVLISSASSTTQTLIDPISDQYRCLMQLKSSAVTRVPDCDSDPLEIPDWFDRTLFDLGRKVAQKHFFSFFVCHLVGLVALVHYLPIMRTLLTTGNSSNLRNLFWRYLNTARHVRLWYEGDVWNPQDSAHKSLALVRSMHLHASRSRNVGAESKTDLNFSQYDMHLTQFAFVGLIVLKPKKFGIHLQDIEMQGVLHFWRVIGHLLGIQDEFNLCAASTTKEIESRCAAILKHEVGPCVREAIECKDRSHLTETTGEVQTAVAMGHGIQCAITGIIKFLYPNTQKKFLLHAFGLETLSDHLNLTGREQFVFNLMRLTLSELIRIGPIRSALNGLLKLSLDRSQRMPEKRLNRIDAKYSQDPLLTCLKADKNLANLPGL